MQTKRIQRLLSIGRLIPMLLSLCALGCYGAWVWAPDWVRAVDTKLILFYTQSGEDRFTACANKIHRDRAAGIAELNELVEEWTGYADRREETERRGPSAPATWYTHPEPQFYDDITGEPLDFAMVMEAIAEEIAEYTTQRLHEEIL